MKGESWLTDILARDGLLGLCDQEISYIHVSDFGQLRCYGRLKIRMEGRDYLNIWNAIINKHNN